MNIWIHTCEHIFVGVRFKSTFIWNIACNLSSITYVNRIIGIEVDSISINLNVLLKCEIVHSKFNVSIICFVNSRSEHLSNITFQIEF